jgi:dihydrofolate reductase
MAARIVVTAFASLDGVMEAPGGEPELKYPAWTFEFDRGDDGNQFTLDETRQSDGLLIGRRTYESFAGAWPQREGEFADKFNSMPKFVVSIRSRTRSGTTRRFSTAATRRPKCASSRRTSTASCRCQAATSSSRS